MGTFTKFSESGTRPTSAEYIPSRYGSDSGGLYSSTSFGGSSRPSKRADLADVARSGAFLRDRYEGIDATPRVGSTRYPTQGALDAHNRSLKTAANKRANTAYFDSLSSVGYSKDKAKELVPAERGFVAGVKSVARPLVRYGVNTALSGAGSLVPGGGLAVQGAQYLSKYGSGRDLGERAGDVLAPDKQKNQRRYMDENSPFAEGRGRKAPSQSLFGIQKYNTGPSKYKTQGQTLPASTRTMGPVASNSLRSRATNRVVTEDRNMRGLQGNNSFV